MKNFKKSAILIMVAVICLCSIPVSYAADTPKQKKIVGYFSGVAQAVMKIRQNEGDEPGANYDYMINELVTKSTLHPDFVALTKQIIDDAFYNHDKMMSPMDKKKEINKFTMLWYYKVCAIVGMNPE